MPAPSESYDWATNATYAAGEEVGLPTKVEPPTAQAEDGWRPGERPPAQYQNFWQHAVRQWIAYFAGFFDGAADDFVYPDGPREREIWIGPRAGQGESGWGYNLIDRATCTSNGHDLFVDLNETLRTGWVLKSVTAFVKPGTSALMDLQLYSTAVEAGRVGAADPADTQLGSTGQSDASNAYQGIAVALSPGHTVDRATQNLTAWLKASSSAGATQDWYFGLKVLVDVPGPR